MNAADDIVSVGGEDCSEKVKEYDDLWSLCQPKNQPFDSSLLGSVPASHVPCRVVERSAPAQSWRSNGAPKYKDGLQFCTESLGFESSDEREDCSTDPTTFHSAYSSIANTEEKALENDRNDGEGERYVSDDTEVGEEFREKQRYFHGGGRGSVTKRCSRATPATFPPPLSSMDPNGHPHVFLKPLRRDGRFLLQEVKVVRNEVLRAWRQDGRLRLQLVRHDDDKQQRCSHLQDDNDGTPTDNEIMDSTQLGEEMVSLTDLTADDDAASDDGDSHVGLECRGDFSREWGAERWNKAGEGQDVHVDSLLQSSGRRSVMDTSLPVFPLKNEGYGRCQEKSKCMSMWEPGRRSRRPRPTLNCDAQ